MAAVLLQLLPTGLFESGVGAGPTGYGDNGNREESMKGRRNR